MALQGLAGVILLVVVGVAFVLGRETGKSKAKYQDEVCLSLSCTALWRQPCESHVALSPAKLVLLILKKLELSPASRIADAIAALLAAAHA